MSQQMYFRKLFPVIWIFNINNFMIRTITHPLLNICKYAVRFSTIKPLNKDSNTVIFDHKFYKLQGYRIHMKPLIIYMVPSIGNLAYNFSFGWNAWNGTSFVLLTFISAAIRVFKLVHESSVVYKISVDPELSKVWLTIPNTKSNQKVAVAMQLAENPFTIDEKPNYKDFSELFSKSQKKQGTNKSKFAPNISQNGIQLCFPLNQLKFDIKSWNQDDDTIEESLKEVDGKGQKTDKENKDVNNQKEKKADKITYSKLMQIYYKKFNQLYILELNQNIIQDYQEILMNLATTKSQKTTPKVKKADNDSKNADGK